MKTATYRDLEGQPFTVEYDESAPCVVCGRAVIEASMGGTAVCPWCDTGHYRDGCEWTYRISRTDPGRMEPVFRDGACPLHPEPTR